MSEEMYSGQKTENKFYNLMKINDWTIWKANPKEDMFNHFDFWIKKSDRKYMVEVKGMKKISRSDDVSQDEWTCVELKGIEDSGWLYGGDIKRIIAFEMRFGFRFILCGELKNLVDKYTKPIYVNSSREAQYKIYRRESTKNRFSEITWIESNKLKEIQYKDILTNK